LCSLALDEASVDQGARIATLIPLCSVDGFRYFEGFAGIAPDADDLGLALQLVARTADPSRYLETLAWPIEVALLNTSDDGEIPVWFDRHLREPMSPDAPRWRGSRCLAVAANALIGLLEARVDLPMEYVDRVIAWLTSTWRRERMRAVFFYGLSYTQFVLVRLAGVAEGKTSDPLIYEQLQMLATDIEHSIIASVRPDGSIGSILDTACSLAALAHGKTSSFDPWPTVAFLASVQEHDGFWPAEPLYPTPGKDYAPGAHSAKAITTAMCLYALTRIRRRLARAND
jgi:hypothetical protein